MYRQFERKLPLLNWILILICVLITYLTLHHLDFIQNQLQQLDDFQFFNIEQLSDSSEAESATQSFREIRHHFGICIESQNEGKKKISKACKYIKVSVLLL